MCGMMKQVFVLTSVLAALVVASEVEDAEQKKRGIVKGSNINNIPAGGQKAEYTYNSYPHTSESSSSAPYQSQIPNSFYPNQANSQYYVPNTPSEVSSYPTQAQINYVPQSQFLPVNFIPQNFYQPKYQLIQSKTPNGNLQLALVQQPSYPSNFVPYPNQYISLAPSQINHQSQIVPQVHSPYNYQQFTLPSPYMGQSSMVFLAPTNPYLNNNIAYPNTGQNIHSFYQSPTQTKYSNSYPQPSAVEYEKLPGPITSGITKDDNDIPVSIKEYESPPDSGVYKNSFTPSRGSSYSKLK